MPPHSPDRQTAWLLMLIVAVLLAFYYRAGVDVVGVLSPRGGWRGLTGTPVSPPIHFALAAVLLGAVPVLAARRLFGARLAELGLGFGRWRAGLAWLAVGLPLAVVLAKASAGLPALRAVYPLDPRVGVAPASFVPYALLQFAYYGSWEVLFRGVLLFGLAPRLGADAANALQTALSVTAHFGRPLGETFLALPAGIVLGKIDLRVGSVWYFAVAHWALAVSLDWFILRA